MRSGRLNRRILIRKLATGQDAAGQPTGAETDVATVWASVKGQTGMSAIRNAGDVGSSLKRYSFRIRFRDDLDEDMWVEYAGNHFNITAIRMDWENREWTDLICETTGA